LKSTMIYVTHDQVEAMTLADKIVVLEFGKIAQVGPPRELYEHPANLFVAQFIGSPKMNVVPCETKGDAVHLAGGKPQKMSLARPATHLGIRPEHIELGKAGSGVLDGAVDVVEYLGADCYVILDCEGLGQLTVRVDGETALKPGDKVGIKMPSHRLHFFDAQGLAIR
ncbi:MAG: TOBE domain-containing protein, partial [Pseudomonadota bacterium]